MEAIASGYKLTEVGVIPEDWRVGNIGCEIEHLEAGVSVNSVDEDVPILEGEQVILKTSSVYGGRFLPHESKRIAPRDIDRAKVNPRAISLIISRMNTPELVGECGYVEHDYQNHFLPDRLWQARLKRDSTTNLKWLSYLLSSTHYKAQLKDAATGTSGSMKNLSKQAFLSIAIPIPTQREQHAIAEVLSDIDDQIAALDTLIAKKRDIKQGAMQELLTGKKRLPGFSDHWTIRLFGEIASPSKSRIDPKTAGIQEFCVELENIEQETGKLLGSTIAPPQASLKTRFQEGDVLFGKLRAYLKKYWLADRSGVCSTEIWALKPCRDLVSSEYLYQIIQHDQFIDAASGAYGTHMPRSDWNVVKNYEVALPLADEQYAISTILGDMDAEISTLEAQREKTIALKQSMMQELLTGKTRLI